MLDARNCLDKDKGFRGRSGQLVTRITKSQTRTEMMEVSPHLNISTRIDLGMDIESAVAQAIARLRPVYEWTKKISRS
jgi:hypothetical protein